MVYFTCNSCGESLKKAQVENHLQRQRCWNSLITCIDCLKDFDPVSFKQHMQCLSENEKYSGGTYKPRTAVLNAERKREDWMQLVHRVATESRSKNYPPLVVEAFGFLAGLPSVASKQKPFLNFINNSAMKYRTCATKVWEILQKEKELASAAHSDASITDKDSNKEESQPVVSESTIEMNGNDKEDNHQVKKKKKKRKLLENTSESVIDQSEASSLQTISANNVKKTQVDELGNDLQVNGTSSTLPELVPSVEINVSHVKKKKKKKEKKLEISSVIDDNQTEVLRDLPYFIGLEIPEQTSKKKKKSKHSSRITLDSQTEEAKMLYPSTDELISEASISLSNNNGIDSNGLNLSCKETKKQKKSKKYKQLEEDIAEGLSIFDETERKRKKLKSCEQQNGLNDEPKQKKTKKMKTADDDNTNNMGTKEYIELSVVTPGKFRWNATIQEILKNTKNGNLGWKKLKRKVCSAYQIHGGDPEDKKLSENKLEAKFKKALNKMPNVIVDGTRVRLSNS